MQRAWKTAVFGAVVGTICAGSLAFANPPNVKHIQYLFHQNSGATPSYNIAWDAMKPLYEKSNSQYRKVAGFSQAHPMIGIGEVNLNKNHLPEIIAYPTEDDVEAGMFCKPNSVCPNYILEVRENKVHRLGVIFASSIDRGDSITNGYWDLKVYSGDWTEPKSTAYDLYTYDKKTDGYVKAQKPPAAAEPQKNR